MARSADVIVDLSPLDSDRIDVPLRVGWLLRTCRLNASAGPPPKGSAFAEALEVAPATVTRWEKGSEDIDTIGLERYENVLGLRPGSLRALVETTRRMFRQHSRRRTRRTREFGLEVASELIRPAMEGQPSGLDWLHFADVLAAEKGLRLPTFRARPVLARLAAELALAIGDAYLPRYEAMARMRSGPYADLVLEVVTDYVSAEHVQVCADLLDVVTERADAELVRVMTSLLFHDSPSVRLGAARGMGNLAGMGSAPKGAMREAVPSLVEAYNLQAADPAGHRLMSELFRNLPPGVLLAARHRLERPLAPAPVDPAQIEESSPSYVAARWVAAAVRAELPDPADGMLHRLLFEAMFDPSWSKSHIAASFLTVVPYRDVVTRHVVRLADRHPAPKVRAGAARLAARLGGAAAGAVARGWAASDQPGKRVAGLMLLGDTGDGTETEVLEASLDDPELRRWALYAAGMSGSQVLHTWADDPGLPAETRGGANWWIAHGGRVTD